MAALQWKPTRKTIACLRVHMPPPPQLAGSLTLGGQLTCAAPSFFTRLFSNSWVPLPSRNKDSSLEPVGLAKARGLGGGSESFLFGSLNSETLNHSHLPLQTLARQAPPGSDKHSDIHSSWDTTGPQRGKKWPEISDTACHCTATDRKSVPTAKPFYKYLAGERAIYT